MQAPPDIARIERDIVFQRRFWRVERVGWAAMAVVVGAALLGAFGGGGPLASAEARSSGLHVAWARVQRLGSTTPIHVTLPPAPGMREAELRLDPSFPARWRVRDMTPPPLEASAGPGAFVLRLRRDEAGHAAIVLHAEPLGGPGLRRLHLAGGGQVLDLPVFVWP